MFPTLWSLRSGSNVRPSDNAFGPCQSLHFAFVALHIEVAAATSSALHVAVSSWPTQGIGFPKIWVGSWRRHLLRYAIRLHNTVEVTTRTIAIMHPRIRSFDAMTVADEN